METTNKFLLWGAMCTEAMNVLYDLRWMIVLVFVLIISDMWYGIRESFHNKIKFRFSRAIRRTCNKTVDYITYLLVGSILGLAILEPLEISNHTISAAVGLLFGAISELDSIIGHICVLKGRNKKFSFKNLFIMLIKKKDEDVGEVIDEQFNGKKDEEN